MNKWLIFFWLSFLSIILLYSFDITFMTENVYFQTYMDRIPVSRIKQTILLYEKWQWVSYIVVPFAILIRTTFTSIFLYVGVFFTEIKIKFAQLFKIALIADFVYVLAGLSKLVVLIFFKQVNTLEDLQFQPLSIMELLNNKTIDPLFVYPLSLLNVFELAYFLVLAWLLVGVINEANKEEPVKYSKSLQLVTASYGSGLVL